MHRRMTDANFIEIHEEISELSDKQMYVQIEYLFQGFMQAYEDLKWRWGKRKNMCLRIISLKGQSL